MRSWIVISLVIICALTVTVEGSTFHFDDQRTGHFSDSGPKTAELVYKVPLTGFVDSSPVIQNGSVYLTNSPGMNPGSEELGLYAVNATNCSVEWKVGGIYGMATPATSKNHLFVHSYANKTGNGVLASFYASNGTERWNVTLQRNSNWWEISSSPLVHNDRVYVLSSNGDLHCFDFQGNELWNKSSDVNKEYFSSPSTTDEWVIYPQNDSGEYYLTAVNQSGSTVWKRAVNGTITNTPAISDGNTYIATESKLYGFEVGGSEIWNISFDGGMSTPAITHNKLFVGSDNGKVYCFNATNGKEVWNFTAIEKPSAFDSIKSSPACSDGIIYFATNEANGTVFALNASSGSVVWKHELGTYAMSSPFIYENKLFIGADDGKMYIIGLWKGEITLTPGDFSVTTDSEDNYTVTNFTALGALQKASNVCDFNYTVNNTYGGSNLYPESIGGIDKGYWCYKVNGVGPMNGTNKYNVSQGDTVRYWLYTESSDSVHNTPNSIIIEVNSKSAYIENMTVNDASQGGNTTAWINATAFADGWYVIVVSGTNTNNGESVAGISTVRLTTGQSLKLPVIVSVPQQVSKGDYELYAGIYKLEDYPNNILDWYGHRTCEVK